MRGTGISLLTTFFFSAAKDEEKLVISFFKAAYIALHTVYKNPFYVQTVIKFLASEKTC